MKFENNKPVTRTARHFFPYTNTPSWKGEESFVLRIVYYNSRLNAPEVGLQINTLSPF